ncbi:uncharacterized protein LOC136085069 [Hydra vulgaris]|uniref:Uncharacterized protein LOC136085069 n=1 Tax=Hydra vulgaris TaxID=6087 RepID=A0ABM4CL28_HYDVU
MNVEEEESQPMVKEMTRKELYDVMKQCQKKKIDYKFVFLEDHLKFIAKCTENEQSSLKKALNTFKFHFKQKWIDSNYIEKRFLKHNKLWLIAIISLPTCIIKRPGRPSKDFELLSLPSKRRRTKALRDQISYAQLTYAAQMSQRDAGHCDASRIMKDISCSPEKANKYRENFNSIQTNVIKKHTPSEVLSIFVEANMTRRQYEIIHAANKNIYPCYSLLKESKKQCYPPQESMTVSETCCEIKLQDILDHTTRGLCDARCLLL